MKPIAPNTLIQNRYLIVHLIGKGGMGEVYLAVDQRLGSAIALKRTFFSDDVLLGNAFEREARTLARLRHPVLPKVSDHFTDEGTQYLVMEHISGEDMSKRLEAMQKPFPLSWVLFWADQLLDSLNYLHTHEPPIIHRDIKPQNLKLTDENHIVLLDFGLSKNSAGETRATTSGGSIVGYTPHYAPMEQIRGTGTDARSDLYSLSATLYQILTANVPPDALTRADSLINGLPDPITPINEINTEVSKAVSDVIVKGMSISQEQRYKSAREMQKALRDAYAQMQTDMSANTVQYSNETKPEVLQSFQKTEVLPVVPIISRSEGQSKSVSEPTIPTGNSNPTPLPSADTFIPTMDFDATMRYDSDVQSPAAQNSTTAQSSTPKQADIKTEVFLAGSSSAISSAQEKYGEHGNDFKSDFKSGEIEKAAFKDVESFSDEDDFSSPKNYSPDATVPLISFGNQADGAGKTAASFGSFSQRDNQTAAPTFTPPTAGSSAEKVFAPTVAPVKQKSKQSLAIFGGLAALLILAVSAVAVGWFVLRDSNAVVEDATPSPTPEATFSVEPTVEPTLEVINDINTNTNGSTNDNTLSSNSGDTNTDNTNVVKPVSSPTKNPTVTPVTGPTRNNQSIPPPPTPRTIPPTPRPIPSNDRPPVTPKPTPKKPPIAS